MLRLFRSNQRALGVRRIVLRLAAVAIPAIAIACTGAAVPPVERKGPPDRFTGSLAEVRDAVNHLAKIEDDNQFAMAYYQLLLKHHLTPIIRKGDSIPVAAGALICLDGQGNVRLESKDESIIDCDKREFVHSINSNGRWLGVADQRLLPAEAVVIRSADLLIIVDMARRLVGFADCNPAVAVGI